jgi:hypothetical protein
MRCLLGTLDEYLGCCCVGSDLAQRLREQFGQMIFEIYYDKHEAAPCKQLGIISLGCHQNDEQKALTKP